MHRFLSYERRGRRGFSFSNVRLEWLQFEVVGEPVTRP
jgi:hypothetical protein